MATGPGLGPPVNRPVPPRIRVLADALVDQIAAGEVVERPASVAKELVENALDAAARRIRVEVREGGVALLAVSDDGHGMTPEEARLAIQRHATSKLASADDLVRIATYGFRGEALPAIASVSRLRLVTRPRGASTGFSLDVDGGTLVDARPAGTPEGTRIEVAELFHHVPARRKFLKSAQTEWGHVADWMTRMALARPDVHLELVRDDRPPTIWPATDDALVRVAAVLSEEDAAAMVDARLQEGEAAVHALVSRPDRHRATAENLFLFVNGRPVRDRLLRHALLDPYRDVLPRGRFPAAVIFLTLPLEAVDVNVHPAKWEVRFADPRAIHHLVSSVVKQALGQRRWLGGTSPAVDTGWRSLAAGDRVAEPGPSDWILAARPEASPAQTAETGAFWPEPAAPTPGMAAGPGAPFRFAELRLLGQLLCTYLLVESDAGLLLVDQHAAHERVLYERLRAGFSAGGVARQALLLPTTLDLAPAAHAAVVEGQEALASLGFELEPFGTVTVVVRAVPALLADHDPADLVRSLADEFAAAGREDAAVTPNVRWLPGADRIFASLACHSARRKGDALGLAEQRALLAALDEIPWAPCCPHGRPVAVPIDLVEIERRFGRR